VDLACVDIRAIPVGCVPHFENCVNCIDWCCPPGSDKSSRFLAISGANPAPRAPAPRGCTPVPADDGTCTAQQKPPHGYRCGTTASGADSVSLDCLGNPYASNTCGEGYDLGYACCP
jgi:hypothetical protein